MGPMAPPARWHFYLVECSDGTLYAGITNDLARRVALHNRGRASRYTRARLPVRLLYSEAHPDRSAAGKREARVRRMRRAAKLSLCRTASRAGSAAPPDGARAG